MENSGSNALCRQLQDIIIQADVLKESKNFYIDFEEFSKYNEEMKRYIYQYNKDQNVLKTVGNIPKLYLRKYWYVYLVPTRNSSFKESLFKKLFIKDIDFVKQQFLLIYTKVCHQGQ